MHGDRSERELPETDPSTYQRVALALLDCDEDGPVAMLDRLAGADLDAHALTTIITLLVPFLAIAHDVNAREALEALWMAVPNGD